MATFTSSMGEAQGNDVTMWEYQDQAHRATWVEGLEWRDVQVIEPLAGYLITAPV